MKILRNFIIFVLLFTSACSIMEANQNKNEATPDMSNYSQADLCEKLSTLVNFSFDKVDRGHMMLLIPAWMKNSIDEKITKGKLIECSVELYHTLVKENNESHRIEKIEALLFFLIEKNITSENDVLNIFNDAFCKDKVTNDYILLESYYFELFNDLPESTLINDDILTEICSSTLN